MSATVATFSFPTATIFGPGTISELPARLKQMGSRRPLIVTDPGLLQTRAFEKLLLALDKKSLGQTWELFHGVHSNPLEQDVIDAAKVYIEAQCDGVVAFGGGSAMDVGKACRLFVRRPDLKLSRFSFQDDWSNLPRCICIPTTAGAGSELAQSSTITLAGIKKRSTIFLPRMLAKLVILDPELTIGLPPHLTAATGIDALSHCIEAFTSPVIQPFCDGIALEGIHSIIRALPKAFHNGKDLDARARMLVAAAMGGVALQKDLGAANALAHPLSAHCGLHHGVATALCLPHVMLFNSQHKPGLYARIGLACGLDIGRLTPAEADFKTIEFIKRFIADLGINGGLAAHGMKQTMLETVAIQAFEDPSVATNPVPVNYDDLKEIYRLALHN